jgi:hypothetical protein
MAKSINQAFSNTKKGNINDELFTPRLIIDAAFPLFKKRLEGMKAPIVLCPFDLQSSEFVKIFQEAGYVVKFGHISTGENFFIHDYGSWDICISNPPFSRKLEIFKRLDSFKKPWAMISNVMALNYQEIINYFADNPKEIIFFDKRISYNGRPSSFGSCFICNDILINKVQYIKLPHNNVGKNFMPSEMMITILTNNSPLLGRT